MIFGRRRARTDQPAVEKASVTQDGEESAAAATDIKPSPGPEKELAMGPFDITQVDSTTGLVNLGALRIPAAAGMQLRAEMDKRSGTVAAISISLDGSALQLQAFAAPRSEGLWDPIREELAESLASQGGEAVEADGPFGVELRAQLPIKTPDGKVSLRPARFWGVDGPRWFVRAVLTGAGAADDDAASSLEKVFGAVVVSRGTDPRPPRELLELTMPATRATRGEGAPTDAAQPSLPGSS